MNGDHMADIVGFGDGGVYVALASGNGHFAAPHLEVSDFGHTVGGWSSQDAFPRTLADVNGDGMADIVGFGDGGAYIALAMGNGNFAAPQLQVSDFGNTIGGWSSQTIFPRIVADVSGDQRADIVGFGDGGVFAALAR